MKTFKTQYLYYLLLLGILSAGFILFLSFSSNPQMQMAIVTLTSFFYVGFALFHHFLNKDLSVKVVIEYVLIAALGISIVYFYLT